MLTSRFSQALVYAAEAHNGQTRKATSIPYVAHVMAVAALALENGANEDEAIAALLHDTVEDCGGLPRLGRRPQPIRRGCRRASSWAAPTRPKHPNRRGRSANRPTFTHLDKASPSVLLVSACDKLHNVRSLLVSVRNDGDAAWARFKGGKEGHVVVLSRGPGRL